MFENDIGSNKTRTLINEWANISYCNKFGKSIFTVPNAGRDGKLFCLKVIIKCFSRR